jgi:hypothetical protein
LHGHHMGFAGHRIYCRCPGRPQSRRQRGRGG